jgi:hypothetical protein
MINLKLYINFLLANGSESSDFYILIKKIITIKSKLINPII